MAEIIYFENLKAMKFLHKELITVYTILKKFEKLNYYKTDSILSPCGSTVIIKDDKNICLSQFIIRDTLKKEDIVFTVKNPFIFLRHGDFLSQKSDNAKNLSHPKILEIMNCMRELISEYRLIS